MKTKFLQSSRAVKIGLKNGAFDISSVIKNREILFWLELLWAINNAQLFHEPALVMK